VKDRRIITEQNPIEALGRMQKNDRTNDRQAFQRFKNQPPSVPVYDPDFPDGAANGQIALQGGMPWYYWNEWLPFSAGAGIFKYIGISGTEDVTGASPQFPNPYDSTDTAGYDTALFTPVLSGSPAGVKILQRGLYFTRISMRWQTDMGTAGVQFFVSLPLGGVAGFVPGFGGDDLDRGSLYFGEGSPLSPAGSFNLVKEGIFYVTTPAGGILLRTEVATDGVTSQSDVAFTQFVMRLSSDPTAGQGA
jgi:hypothetical protein